jgi:hypothetical protein
VCHCALVPPFPFIPGAEVGFPGTSVAQFSSVNSSCLNAGYIKQFSLTCFVIVLVEVAVNTVIHQALGYSLAPMYTSHHCKHCPHI